MDIDGDLNNSVAATFNAGSSTINIEKDYTNADTATFNEGTSTVDFDGPIGTTQYSDPGGDPFYKMVHSGASTLIVLGDTIIAGGDFVLSDGIYDTNDKKLTVYGDTIISGGTFKSGIDTVTFGNDALDTVTVSGTAVFEIETPDTTTNVKYTGTWTNTGGTIVYKAATAESTELLSGIADYYNLEINSTGSTYTLDGDIGVGGNLIITAGTLDAGADKDISVVGNWTNLDGFVSRAGTVDFNGTGTQTIITGGTAEAQDFYDLSHTGSSSLELSTNDVRIDNAFNNSGGAFVTNDNNMYVGGDWTNSDVFTSGTSTVYFEGASGTQTITSGGVGAGADFYDVEHTGAGTAAVAGDIKILNNFTNSAGTWDVSDQAITIDGNTVVSDGIYDTGTGINTFGNAAVDTVTISGTSVVNIESDNTLTDIVKNATWSNPGGTIVYKAAVGVATALLSGLAENNYNNLIIDSASSTYTMNGDLDINGDFTITNGTVDAGTNQDMSLAGDWTNNGGFVSQLGTVDFDGAGTQTIITGGTVATQDFYDLNHTGSSTLELSTNDIKILNNLNNSGGAFTSNNNDIYISGNWTNTDTFNSGTSEVIFEGSGTQQLNAGGMVQGVFYDLTHSGTGTLELLSSDLKISNDLVQSDGTFDVNDRKITIAGDTTISDGIYNTGDDVNTFGTTAADTVTVSGTSVINIESDDSTTDIIKNATWSNPGGTIVYKGPTSTALLTGIGENGYNNLTIDSVGFSYSLDGPLTLNGDLTILNGFLDLNGESLTLQPTSSFTNNGTLRLVGNESLTAFVNATSTGTVEYYGTGSYNTLITGNEYFNLSFTGSGTYNLDNDLDVNGTLDVTAGVLNLNGNGLDMTGGTFSNTGTLRLVGTEVLTAFVNDPNSGIIEYSGTGTYSGLNAGDTYHNLTFSNTGVYSLTNDLDVNNILDINGGTLDLAGSNLDLTGATFSNTGTLRMVGTETLTAFSNDTDSGIIEYNGTGSYTGLIAGNIYHGLEISNGGTYTLDAALDVNNSLNISNGTLALNNNTLDLSGATFSNDGTLKILGTETLVAFNNDTDSGIIEYAGGGVYGALITGYNYFSLAISGGGIFTIPVALDLNGNFILSNGFFTAPNGDFNIGGDFNHSGGTFTHNDGNVIIDGAVGSISQILGDTTFNNFTSTVNKTLQFGAGSTQTIIGLTTLTGGTLKSTSVGGQWSIDPQGVYNISSVSVQDSINLGPTLIDPSGSTDLGNNVNWFPAPPPVDPNPPVPPDVTPPDTVEGDGGRAAMITIEGLIDTDSTKYDKWYKEGKYRTVVIVFEGKVVVSDYDKGGARYDDATVLTGGEKTSAEGEVKKEG